MLVPVLGSQSRLAVGSLEASCSVGVRPGLFDESHSGMSQRGMFS